ncbi:MAG: exosortase/archaeosortase family protein [Phycisphaerales bacterium JB037]
MASSTTSSATSPTRAAEPSPPERVLGIFTPTGLWMFGAVTIAFVAMFYRWILQQNAFSSNKVEDWGHAYVIPLISGYMVWQSRDRIARIVPRTFPPGLIVLATGLFCYAYFNLWVPNHMLAGGAFVLSIFGAALTLLGPRGVQPVFLPIAFLVFAITISEMIMINLTFALQRIASEGAFAVLAVLAPVLGFDVELSGNVITMVGGDGKPRPMNVAEACSGMRMVVAFVALAGAVALLGAKAWWQRTAVFLLAFPVAILMNVIRVAVLGLLMLVNPNLSEGDSHTLIGTLLLIPALGLFMLSNHALSRIFREPGQEASS